MFKVPEKNRVTSFHRELPSLLYSTEKDGCNGAFVIERGRTTYNIMASDGDGWEHVSVHCVSDGAERTPTWAEMCWIKDKFWDEDDVVIQFHPAKEDYVNMHKYTLHLWRPVGVQLPVPNKLMVGF